VKALRDPDPNVRMATVCALGNARDQSAVPDLLEILRDSDGHVQRQALEVLRQVADAWPIDAWSKPETCMRWRVRLSMSDCDPEWVTAVMDFWERAPDAGVRRAAAEALGEIGDPRAVDALLGALNDPDALLRCEAVVALGRIRDARAVPRLQVALRDEDFFMLRAGAVALGYVHYSRFCPLLHDRPPKDVIEGALARIAGADDRAPT
jgi:HEAT repeat protein